MERFFRSRNLHLLARQFTSPIVVILIGATVVSMILGDFVSGFIILLIIFPSGLLGYFQERRAGKIMDELLKRIQIEVEVIRGGKEISIPENEVVVGDRVILRVGDIIPSDCVVEESSGLLIDESALTGESFPREKHVGELKTSAAMTERDTELFQGTHVVGGKGIARVIKVGSETEFGAIVRAISSKDVRTGFERGTLAFGFLILRAMSALVVGLFIVNLLLHKPVIESLLFSLALAVGLTPQLLPVIISVSLSVGARAMAERKVLVKRLDAIEDLGIMNILCTDKTGTLTSGVIKLQTCLRIDESVSEQVAHLAILNSSLQSGFVNPIDQAVIDTSKKSLGESAIAELAYDFDRRRLSVLTESSLLITKGALESVLTVCTEVNTGKSVVPIDSVRSEIRELFERLSSEGKRVLGISSKQLSKRTLESSDESAMRFEGFLVFEDPPKEGAAAAIAEMQALGIKVILITGDNHLVAAAISKQVGIDAENVVTGSVVDSLSDNALAMRVKNTRVFAEIHPVQKERIVNAARIGGNTVGFFGDGINDSAALHAADIGISVDTAVDVAKSAASVVLLEKDLAVLAQGVRLGRKTFVNTLKYVRVGISAAFGNVFSMAIADIFLPFLPLLPMQILLLNFMTDFPAVTISGDSVDSEAIQAPKKWSMKSIRRQMIIFGLISTLFDLLTFLVLKAGFHVTPEVFRSGWFVESTLTELSVMLVLRTKRRFWKSRPGKGLMWSSLILAISTVVLPYVGFAHYLGFAPIPLKILAILVGLISIYIAINEFAKVHWWHE